MHTTKLKAGTRTGIATTMLTAALFAIAQRYPSMDGQTRKCVTHTEKCYSALKRQENPYTCDNEDEPWGHSAK